MGLHSEAELNRKFMEFAKLLNVYLNHFPKSEKYGLSQQIRQAAYDVYGMIVEAQKRFHKKTTLANLNVRHEQLRMFINLAQELGYFEFKDGARSDDAPRRLAAHRHVAVSRLVDELGRMIGGWVRAERLGEAS
jgi:four helix bundle protein